MFKHFSKMLIFLLLAYACPKAYANVVSVDNAKQLAANFFSATHKAKLATADALELAYTAGNSSKPLYYVFNAINGNGFVIVSAEDCTTPILGYSLENAYDADKIPDAMKWMMEGLEKEIKAAPSIQRPIQPIERSNAAYAAGANATNNFEKVLNTPTWSQEGPFNSMIPNRPLVGCVGTAMASIMKYHNYPEKGTGSFDGVNFDVEYDWENMRTDNYRSGYTEAQGNAVALLMWHAAKSIDTQFGMSGSSAYEVRVPAALSNYFGYDPGVSYKKRSEVSTQQAWDNIVKNEIDAGRPVLYCGQDVTAGHAFVCDGYNSLGYLHFNWGWGGAANGFFLSTALNPSVSTNHHFNNLNTIIYNIKPGNGNSQWSTIHITADGNQPGIGSDMTDLASGKTFTVRVGNLKNLSYSDFSGKIAVALFDAAGNMKTLLSEPSGFNLKSMATLGNGYIDLRNCSLPAVASVGNDDMLRIATSLDNGKTWLPVAGELLTVNEIPAKRTSPNYFSIKFPTTVEGAAFNGENKVIRGWNYAFTVTPSNPAEDVVTVKANGYILTAGNNNNYSINNVKEDQEIAIIVQKASEVKEKRSIWVNEGGQLASIIPDSETGTIKDLTLFGTIDARDFEFMRTKMKLSRLDISSAYIAANGSSQACALPKSAFQGQWQLKEVILPGNLNRINNAAFRQCGITSIIIPAGVKTYEYNIFLNCSSLRHIWVGRETAEFINWCVLAGTSKGDITLHVPNEKAVNNYKNKEYWNEIGTIIVDPIPAKTDFAFAVMENSDVRFNTETPAGRVQKGTIVTFTAKHMADNDERMDVYANSTLLRPDGNGNYTTTINTNTIIHFDMVKPMQVNSYPSYWQLTNTGGTVGLLTDAVNVIPGQKFTIRANALYIPAEYSAVFWAAVLTDSNNNIKEFISPISAYSGITGDGLKMNINCCVNEATVREGNKIRLVTSFNKKTWSLIEGKTDDVIDALPALNNQTPVYNINIPTLNNAVISGAVATAVHGRDITIKVVPKSAADRVNMSVNGTQVAKNATSASYSFIAKQDMDFDIEVYTPSAANEVTYTIGEGEHLYYNKADNANYINLNNDNLSKVGTKVTVIGKIDKTDFDFFKQPKVQRTIVSLDLSQAEIVADRNYPQSYAANMFPPNAFYSTTPFGQSQPILKELKLPASVVQIMGNAFNNCAKIEELELPENLYNEHKQTTSSGSWKYVYGLEGDVFSGCTSLKTLYVNCAPVNGKVSLIKPTHGSVAKLGLSDPSKVTVIVKPEYLKAYLTDNQGSYGNYDGDGANIWYGAKFNILSEYPVYGINFEATRCFLADSKLDVTKVVSFLGDNVPAESLDFAGQLFVAALSQSENRPTGADGYKAGQKVRIYDNGKLLDNATESNGSLTVTYWNPNKHADKSGNHDIKVTYLYDVTFNCTSDIFTIGLQEVHNNEAVNGNEATEFEKWNTQNPIAPVLENVKENTTVRFTLETTNISNENVEPKVKIGDIIIEKDEEGYYNIDVTDSNITVQIFTVPVNGATLTQEEFNSINPNEAVDITTISLTGKITNETLGIIASSFTSLEELDLSDMDGTIPANTFAGMKSLVTVTLPDVETVEPGTFKDCENLTTVTIPPSVNTIGDDAFNGCSSLNSITLTGINSIGAGAFNGCNNLTSINLNAPSAAPAAKKRNLSRAIQENGFSPKAFDGVNPNCLILVDDGVDVPQTQEGNFIVTTIGDVTEVIDGETVVRQGRIYFANGNINLQAGYPLSIANTFSLKEANTISLKTPVRADVDGKWSSLLLPFNAEKATAANGNELTLTANKENAKTGQYTVISLNNENEYEAQSTVMANTPYLVRLSADDSDQEICFSATGTKVAATPREIKTAGKDYSLAGTYNAIETNANTYILNEQGNAFEKVAAEDNENQTVSSYNTLVAPFSIYAVSESDESAFNIVYNVETSDIENLTESGSDSAPRFCVENGNLVVYTGKELNTAIYSIDGRMIGTISLSAGRNVITGLSQGAYIISGQKVIL